jgi:hypothetical protein
MWLGATTNLRRLNVDDKHIMIDSTVIEPSGVERDLGVYCDAELSMCDHLIRIAQTCFYHLRCLRSIHRLLRQDAAAQLVSALVLTRIDYCNAVLADSPSVTPRPLQRVINAAARLVFDLSPHDHVTLLQLHWPPIEYRVRCKLCLLVHQAINGRAPPYLANLLTTAARVSSRASRRSAGCGDLLIPATKLKLGNRAFSVSGPTTFNDLQTDLKSCTNNQYSCF